MLNELEKELYSYWLDTLTCSKCGLKRSYSPQYRPVGDNYVINNIVFFQINPGHIGRLSEKQIQKKYKFERSREIARLKQKLTKDLYLSQKKFMENPGEETWKEINITYRAAIKIAGWPPGKYLDTISMHGVDFEDTAVLNIAQCPTPNDKYTNKLLKNCWLFRTEKLINILKPSIIIAQGKVALNFIEKYGKSKDYIILEGVHHAFRGSNKDKNVRFTNVKSEIKSFL